MVRPLPLHYPLFCFCAGIWLGVIRPLPGVVTLAGLCWLVAIIAVIHVPRTGTILLSSILALWFSNLYTQWWRTAHTTNYPTVHKTLHGEITAAPDIRSNGILLTLTPPGANSSVLVHAPRYPVFHYGDEIEATGDLSPPEQFSGFNYPLYLERFTISSVIQQAHVRLITPAKFSLIGALYTLRSRIEGLVNVTIPEPEASFLSGILLGSKRAIPADVQAELQQTGTMHIIAISGANITILLELCLPLLPLTTLKRQFWGVVSLGTFVALLTGASASVVRGASVASLGRYIRMHGRPISATSIILSSAAVMLLINPLLIQADPGFQLSFAAYAGLLYLGTPVTKLFNKASFLPQSVRSAASETTAASVGTTALLYSMRGILNLWGLLVNPLILWLLPAITLLGLLFITFGWWGPCAEIIKLPLWLLLHTVLQVIHFFGKLVGAP